MKDLLNLFDPNGDELCGIVLQDGTVKMLPNLHEDPHDNFAMSTTLLSSPEVVGTWHTHPRSSPNLTVADYLAFREWPRLLHYIVGATEVWCYRMSGDILVLDDNPNPPRLSARPSP